MQQGLEAADPNMRPHVERELMSMATRLKEYETQLAEAQTRRSRASQAVAAEEGRYDELERLLDEFEMGLRRLSQ